MVVDNLPQRQQNRLVVSRPNNFQAVVGVTHITATSSPATTLSIVEPLTTSSAIVTSVSEQNISTTMITTGVLMYALHIVNQIHSSIYDKNMDMCRTVVYSIQAS